MANANPAGRKPARSAQEVKAEREEMSEKRLEVAKKAEDTELVAAIEKLGSGVKDVRRSGKFIVVER